MGNTCRIKIPHFWCLEYYEGDKKMTVDIDFRDPVLYLNTKLITRWDEPFEKETITGKEFMKIFRELKGLPDSEDEQEEQKKQEKSAICL